MTVWPEERGDADKGVGERVGAERAQSRCGWRPSTLGRESTKLLG
jgi:hypothetical protein